MSKFTAYVPGKSSLFKKSLLLIFIYIIQFTTTLAQAPKVPSVIDFAGMKLRISEHARKNIQSDVDALYRSEKYFKIKVERVDLYFPIIERILKEEGVPEDFKYLVIQESSLISDAVSTSNAVGFWQFKQDAGEEVGLKINAHVDERMNIVSSTRGAATYIKKHNSYFNNWVYSLLAYYMGRGGAKSVAEPKYFGAEKMEIDKETSWYVLKFLAHKIAFENALKKNPEPSLILAEYEDGADKTLKEIGQETEIEIELLEHYNKWLKRGRIPVDKQYTVILPLETAKENELLVVENKPVPEVKEDLPEEDNKYQTIGNYPVIEGDLSNRNEPLLVTINGRPGIISRKGDNIALMAEYGGVKEARFRKINDIKAGHKVIEGQYYYFKNKRNNAPVHYHTVQEGENLWEISQRYGVKQAKILRKNRMSNSGAIKPGMVLWMRYIRPANEPVTYRSPKAVDSPDKNIKSQHRAPEDETKETSASISKPDTINDAPMRTGESIRKEVKTEDNKEAKIDTISSQKENKPDSKIIEEEDKPKVEEKLSEPQISESEEKLEEVILKDSVKDDDFFDAAKVNFVENTEVNNEGNGKHVVQQGETLYGISRKYNIPIQDLIKWNELKSNESINIGQVLLVKSPSKVTNEVATDVRKSAEKVDEIMVLHTVLAGETLYKIAREHNVTIKEVMEWNGKTDFNVALGEVIKIKKIIGND